MPTLPRSPPRNSLSFPDDSVTDVALQTFLAVPLATLFPVLFGALGVASGAVAKKA